MRQCVGIEQLGREGGSDEFVSARCGRYRCSNRLEVARLSVMACRVRTASTRFSISSSTSTGNRYVTYTSIAGSFLRRHGSLVPQKVGA